MKTRLLGIVFLCAAAGVLASAGAWMWMSNGPVRGSGPSAVAPVPIASATGNIAKDGALRGGIGVHGHWVVEVRNPDGTLDRRVEFDNSLEDQGLILVKHLTGYRHIAGWSIVLSVPGIESNIREPDATHPLGTATQFDSYTLAVTHIDAGSYPTVPTIRLSGTTLVGVDFSLDLLWSWLDVCKTPACADGERWGLPVTRHSLSPAVPLLKGQQLLVTVDITFETA